MRTFLEILMQMMGVLIVITSMCGLSFMTACCIVKRVAFKHPFTMALAISAGVMWCLTAMILAIV